MLAPIEWRQIGGYPPAAFCPNHDRLIDPIILQDGNATSIWACPYCAEEQMPPNEVKTKEPERPTGFYSGYGSHYNYAQVTYWCPEKRCHYNTSIKQALDMHIKFVHSPSNGADKMKCSEGLCDKDAFDFCAQCESPCCKDHMDWKDMCTTCGANGVFPGY